MRRTPTPVLLALSLAICGCASTGASGEANGVSFRMSTRRPPVPGGTPFKIEILAETGGTHSELRVDGVSFGRVTPGDHVEVTDAAKVLVDGEERLPR